jgi:hypothetical protein
MHLAAEAAAVLICFTEVALCQAINPEPLP